MKLIYIAGRFRERIAWELERNVRRAEEAAFRVAELGGFPIIPHANSRYFHGTISDEFWLEGYLELVGRCDAVFLLKSWESSAGAVLEYNEAMRKGLWAFQEEHKGYRNLQAWLNREEG
ncbi:MAG: DUF4406 domain-containing protein [Planctomycetota bacterium]|jgi:hypothetical protein